MTAVASSESAYWQDQFEQNPDALFQLLNDLYVITQTNGSPTARRDRRGKGASGSLEELWGMLTPQYATVPFGEAVRAVQGPRSVRQMAMAVGVHHSYLARLLDGSRPIIVWNDLDESLRLLQAVAKVLDVHPAYFCEWRRLWVYQTLDQAFEANPEVSIGLVKRYVRKSA